MRNLFCKLKYYFLILLFVTNVDAQESFSFKHITSIEGLSHNTVHDIVQDEKGYIWIATIEGLNRFDGNNIVTYYKESVKLNSFSNIILDLFIASDGKMYVGTSTGLNVYDKNSDSFESVKFNNNNLPWIKGINESSAGVIVTTVDGLFLVKDNIANKQLDGNFRAVFKHKNGNIWVAQGDDILLLDKNGKIISVHNNSTHKNGIDFSKENVESIFIDSRGIVWLGTKRDGLAYYDAVIERFFKLEINSGVNKIEDNMIRAISEDSSGKLWVGTESGLYTYDVINQVFEYYGQNYDDLDNGLNDKAIYSIFRDKDNLMWIGTFFGGVNYTNPNAVGFNNINADGGRRKLSGNAVSSMIETSDGKIWIATENGGISILNRENNTFEYIRHNKNSGNTIKTNNVHALEEDRKGDIWIGTFLGGISRYDHKTKKIEQAVINKEEEDDYISVFSLEEDSKGRLWAASITGLFRKDKDEFNKIYKESIGNIFLRHINEDSNGDIWVCSNFRGVYRLKNDTIISNYNLENTPELINNMFMYSFEDSEKIMWFGTQEGGLVSFDTKNDKFKVYTTEDGLPGNSIFTIEEDNKGFLWISTTKGLVRMNKESEIFEVYNKYDGLVGNQFNHSSCLKTSDDIMFFGTVNGVSYFDPNNIKHFKKGINLHFTDFKLFNKSVHVEDEGILSENIDKQKEITLSYADNVFTIDYLNINYTTAKKTSYAYYLEGFEKNWNYVANKTSATYTNLSPGEYTFKLKATNRVGDWTDGVRTIKIIVKPPFWLSIWGYLTYFLIIILILYAYIKFIEVRNKEKLSIQLTELDKKKNEEINAHRLNFFTYISHEFKTPLSIVIATIDEMLLDKSTSETLNQYGITIKKNAYRLLSLINQLMEFRKIETDHASLKSNKGDIVKYINSIVTSFEPLMEKRSVEVNVNKEVDSYESYFDGDKVEKIISNILSNSIKAFEGGGLIRINITVNELNNELTLSNNLKSKAFVSLTISDNGPGMSEEKLAKLFDPFYSDNTKNNLNSGIGLALVNSLVKLLDGKINVKSTVGSGTEFQLIIPLFMGSDIVKEDDFIESVSDSNINLAINDLEKYDTEKDVIDDKENKKHEMLIVEDNKDLQRFLKRHYSKYYKVSVAYNGEEALIKVEKSQPDIIISDVMMPKMDGNQLTDTLKRAIETSHIPIILLTAKTGIESKLEGLSAGADAYVNKPFNLQELDLKVRNILKSIEGNRKKFVKFDTLDDSIDNLQNSEAQFVNKLTDIILENIDNSEFHINELCDAAAISRPHLHRKLKKTTGLSTTEFIRNVKLNEAKKLLASGSYRISEVAVKVGYSDSAYFSKSFKKVFEKSPSEFLKEGIVLASTIN
ncbi:MAG: two-component regulator propeller domain-containing protein [Bacteroidota bacterium]